MNRGLPFTAAAAAAAAVTLSFQVDYRERLSAVGRLPLRPDRRERVGSERELLVARLVDRALRPLIPPGFLYDTQVGGRWPVQSGQGPGGGWKLGGCC
jgi:polyribonucleotide nucleotidyltransferase